MQIKENRPYTARSGYSVRCKPFGRMTFRRTIRTRQTAGATGAKELQFHVIRTVGYVRLAKIRQVGQDSAMQNPLESIQSQLHSNQ